jgi:hypothetical protein
MPAQLIRLVTSGLVIGLCACAIWKGSDLIRFARAGSTAQDVQPWSDVSGVAFDARETALTPMDDSSTDATIRQRRDQLAEMLAIRPLSSWYWLQLANARVDLHEPLPKILSALELSTVTGPNEDYMITERGLFGVWQWEILPPEVQRRSIADLVAVRPSDANVAWLKTTLDKKSGPVRDQIRTALQTQGFPPDLLKRIGLVAE